MARVPGLKNRNGRWMLRVRVPDDIRRAIKKLEISKSFGAVPHLEACRLARIERTEIDQRFAEARVEQRQTPIAEVSESELRHLARAHFYRLEQGASDVPLDNMEREASQDTNFDDLKSVSQAQIDGSLQRVAIDFAKKAKIAVVPGTPAFRRLCEGIQRAEIEHHLRQADRLALLHARPKDPLFFDVSVSTPPSSPLTLAQAVARYKGAPERSGVADKRERQTPSGSLP